MHLRHFAAQEVSEFEQSVTEWTSGWAQLLTGIIALSLLMALLIWVYHSMQRPRLYLGVSTGPQLGEPHASSESIIRYAVTTPVALLVWLIALITILTIATSERTGEEIALAAAVVIGATRLLAHLSPVAAHEISKTIPLVVVTIILIGGAGGAENFVRNVEEIVANADSVDAYYFLLLAFDVLVTTLWALRVRSRWRANLPDSRRREMRTALAPLRDSIRSIRQFGRPEVPYDWRSNRAKSKQ